MKGMDDRQYLGYLDHIEDFLNSEKAYQFSSEYFVNNIIGEIKKTIEAQNNHLECLEANTLRG